MIEIILLIVAGCLIGFLSAYVQHLKKLLWASQQRESWWQRQYHGLKSVQIRFGREVDSEGGAGSP